MHDARHATARDVLAESEDVTIVQCGTSGVHFRIGPVTFQLTPAEFAEVAAVVFCAIDSLSRRSGNSGPQTH